MERIIVFCAHNDDQIIGAGGTLINTVKKGGSFKTVIFAYGRSSHPHLKEDYIRRVRVVESLRSDKILGGKGIAYLGLRESNFMNEFKEKKIRQKIQYILTKEKPTKIFTHSADDPHPDHKAVHNLIKDIVEELPFKVDAYTFDVWNLWSFKKHQQSRMVVDISESFATKMKALRIHKSQRAAIFTLWWSIWLRAITNGWDYGFKYAETFHRMNT